jgi:hypothetical protein
LLQKILLEWFRLSSDDRKPPTTAEALRTTKSTRDLEKRRINVDQVVEFGKAANVNPLLILELTVVPR